MKTEQIAKGEQLEFEPVEGASDLRVSKSFESRAGTRLRATLISRNRAVIAPVRAPGTGLGMLAIDGLEGGVVAVGFWKEAWDTLKDVIEGLDTVTDGGGGGGQTCRTETNVSVGSDGRVTNITTTTVCSAA
jgi:hypothetical protein